MLNEKKLREITVTAALAALYFALCFAFAGISYGPVQFRIAEVLLILAAYNKKYCAGIIIGTFIANQYMYGWIDMLAGTFATVLVCAAIILAREGLMKKAAAVVAASLFNGVIIGLMLSYIFGEPGALWFIMATVALGQLAVVLAGALMFSGAEKTNPGFIESVRRMNIKRGEKSG